MKTNQLFSKARWLLASCLLLLIFSTNAWGAMELANINFKSWTPQSISAGSTVNGCYFKSAVTITAANGATFSGKASTSSNWVAIPLSGINGSITITLTHASGRPQWGNYLKGLNAAPSSSDLSSNPSSVGDNTRPGSNTTTSSWTINTDKLYGVFYVGKGSNGLSDIYSITITTPDWTYYYRGADNSWGGTEMTKSSAGFYSYKSSTTNNHQFKIAKSESGWDYNYSFVDAGYLGTSITTIGDYGSDNCYIWSAPASYNIIVFRPGSPMNTTANPKICASATLPAEKFTISFNNGGGSGSMSSISNVLYGSDKATTANTFTKAGYRFTGWKANVDVKVGGATKTAGTLLDDEVTIQEIKSDITLTAQWEVDDGCNKIFWFANSADAETNGVKNNTTTFSGVNTGTSAVTGSITIDGKTYTATGRGSNNATTITFTVPASKVGTLYGLANSSGNSARTLTLTNTASYSGTQSTSASSSTAGAFTFADMPAGSYSLAWSGNGAENMLCLKLCDAAAPSCSATQPGSISKSLSACTLTLTASGDPASNNTWYWQSAADGTATNLGTGATKTVTTTGTWYIRSYCSDGSGCWSEAQTVTVSASDLTPAAPTALANSSVTAKGVTLTVTDAANTNDYEFYVNTSSAAPSAGTSASYTSTSKSVTITDKYAGTTFYAWARAKCGSNKSAWTALTGSTFTTSTVSAAYHLTNVSKTSGAESGIGGSTFTAVFSANTDYSMPTPVVTIGGNAATSGTDYTWTEGTGTLTIAKEKITGYIDITLNSVPSAPSSAVISGTYHYFPGDNISLTCTPSGNNGPTTYQWYKGGKADGNRIDGATSATYTKNSCAFADAGSYYCKVTCNETSIWANTNSYENYDVKILRLYVNGSKSGEPYGNVDFTKVDGTTATASIALGSGWTYGFNIADGCGHYYGNAGTMQENNCTNWTTNVNGTDCGLTTTNAATYIFTINYSSLEAIVTSVTYPVGNQAADKVIYFDNNVLKWTGSSIYYRIGHSSHSQASQLSLVPGTANLYKMTTTEYNGFSGWHIANATGDVGSGKSIYKTVDGTPITEATAHEGGAVTQKAITVTPTTSKGYGADVGVNDNCEFFNYTITTGMKTDNVAISDYSNGTITVAYTDVAGVAQSFTSGSENLAHTVIITPTATPATGYDLGGLTVNAVAHTSGNTYTCSGATVVAATFTPHVYSIALNKGDHGAANQSASVAYLADALTSITHVAANTGYNRLGYYDGATKVLNADGSFAASTVSGYITDGVWTKTSDAALTAKWEAQTYTISYKDKGNKTYSGSNLASLPTSHTYGSSTALVDGVKSGYTFVGWYTDEDCTVYAGSSIGATAKTANFTLYAKWTYSCPADNSGETIYKFVPVTSSSDNIADATDFTTENYLSELTGGTLVSHCSASGNVKMNSNGVQLASSTGYLELNFECALQTGDKVKWKCYSAAVRLCNSTTYDSSKDLVLAKSQDSYSELYITSSMEGKKKLYLMHSGSNSTVMTFELYRAGGYNVTYKANGSGESDVAHVTATVEDNMFTRNGYTFTGWNTDDEGEGDAYSAGAAVTEDLTLYAQWTCTTPTFGTNLSTTPHEVEQGDAAVTLTVAATANSGTVTYQWYSNTSKSTVGATPLTTGASYNAPTSLVGTLYYYCVATNSTSGCSTTAQSNYATVTVSEAPCFKFVAGTTKAGSGWDVANNGSITTSLWSAGDPVLTGGTMTNTSGSTISAKNKSSDTHYGLVYAADGNKQVTVTLSGSHVLAEDAIITINGFSNNTTTACGFKISGNDMSPATYTPESKDYTAFMQTYKVTAGSALEGASSFTVDQATSVRVYLKSISVTGCVECTSISPTLTAGTTTLYSYPAPTSTTLTLDKDGSTGDVIWTSSDASIASVSGDGTSATVTAVGTGSATITASIDTDGTRCAKSVSKTFTVTGGCGYNVIASAVLTSKTAATTSGCTLLASNMSNSSAPYKLDKTLPSYFGLQLSSGSFQVGDSIIFKVKIGDMDINDGTTYPVAVFTSTSTDDKATAIYTSGANAKGSDNVYIRFVVTSGMLTALNTNKQVLIIRNTNIKQNHSMYFAQVKRYVCPEGVFEFNDASSDGKWSTAGNWIDDEGVAESLPTISDRVIISKPVTVDDDDAVASEVILDQKSPNTGKLTIDAGNALIIAGTLKKTTTGTSVVATAAADVIINSTRAAGTGALVMGSHDGTNAATVNFETKVKYDNGYVNQYLGSPFSDETPYVDYEIQLYKFVPQGNGSHGWWNKLSYGDEMVPFMGYNQLSNNTSGNYLNLNGRTGHLNASSNVEFTIANGKMYYNSSWPENMFANSWTAPIHIDQFEDGDFTNVKKVIYIFNAGTPAQYNEAYGGENSLGNDSGDEDNEAAGTYTVIPVKSAAELSALGAVTTVIPAMQAFSVMATSSSPSLTLNFNRLVYTPALTSVDIEPTRAPKREQTETRPDAMRLRVRGENGWTTNAYILGREDFTEGYDDGWDGEYMEGDGSAPQLYSATEEGYFVVNCVPEIEGTLMAFHPGSADNAYTFSFVYKGTETWYLNDLKEQQSTLISNETSYPFVSVAGDKAARFVISKTPINKIVTGIDETNGEKDAKVRKLLIDDHIYIIRGGKMYTADGALVK